MPSTLLERRPITVTQPIHAWRAWTLSGSRDGCDVRLLPIAGDGRPWPPRAPASGSCTRRRFHAVPDPECSCGLYGVMGPDELRRTRDPAVVGTVSLWGRVVEHEHGYRAASGYPQRLRLVCYLCFCLWGSRAPRPCEIVVRHRGGRMVPLCAPHLELSLRYGYRVPATLEAADVEAALLSTYAVDLLRDLSVLDPRLEHERRAGRREAEGPPFS